MREKRGLDFRVAHLRRGLTGGRRRDLLQRLFDLVQEPPERWRIPRQSRMRNGEVLLDADELALTALAAEKFGGGGHRNAAGCTLKGDWDEVEREIIGLLQDAVQRANGGKETGVRSQKG